MTKSALATFWSIGIWVLRIFFGFLVADFIPSCETFNLLIGGDINHEDLVDKVGQIDLKEEWDNRLNNPVRIFFGHFPDLTEKRLKNARVCNPF